jgi:membrane-associated protease RseP (regulator of RpoE activity)
MMSSHASKLALALLTFFILPPSGAPAEEPAATPCLIVKHKGTIGRRLIFTALIGVPIAPGSKYDLVDSLNYHPEKMSFKGKDLQRLQKESVRVIVLQKNYAPAELDDARRACMGSGGESTAASLGLKGHAIEEGFKITAVAPGSPAAKSFLNPGDILLSVNGLPVHSGDEIDRAVAAAGGGELNARCRIKMSMGYLDSDKKFVVTRPLEAGP